MTVAKVLDRDQGQCVRCGSRLWGDRGHGWSIHHRAPRSSGGSLKVAWVNLPGNLLLLCGSGTTGCHGWIEGHRGESVDLGFLVSRIGVNLPEDVPVHHGLYGLVLLTDDGGFKRIGTI